MIYSLPKTVLIDNQEYRIRYDFRVILTILEMLNDADLSDADKAAGLLEMFYVNPEGIKDFKLAVDECYKFIDMGEMKPQKKSPRVMDWEQDFNYIIAPINRVMGQEIREIPYDYETSTGGLHWWTFMGAYMEIGSECLFSQLISIRDKRARGKKLEKHEREWMHRNIEMVEFKRKFSDAENDLAKEWMGGEKHG